MMATGSLKKRKWFDYGEDEQNGSVDALLEPNTSTYSERSTRIRRSHTDDLCRRCAKVHLENYLSRRHIGWNNELVKKLDPVASDSCPMCGCIALNSLLLKIEKSRPD